MTKFQRSPETNICIELLEQSQIDELIPYAVFSEACGADIQTNRQWLETAKRYCENNYGMVFETEYKQGVRRLSEEGKHRPVERLGIRINNAARRQQKILGTVKISDLTPEGQVRHNFFLSQAGALQQMTAKKKQTIVQPVEKVYTVNLRELVPKKEAA